MKIKEVIVVEGKNDQTHLKSFLDVDIVITRGSAIDKETLEFLKLLNQNQGIIILTDPDFPGEKIRKTIQEYVGECKHAFVKKSQALGKNKVGIETTSQADILRALENVVTFKENNKANITQSDLIDLGLIGSNDSKNKRKILSEHFNLGWCNGKTFLKRLNMLNIKIENVKEVLK